MSDLQGTTTEAPAPTTEAPVTEAPAAPAEGASILGEAPVAEPAAEGTEPEATTEEPAAEVVPLTTADITLPEGAVIAEETMGKFVDFVNGKGLAKDAAQELVDLHMAELQSVATKFGEAQLAAYNQTVDGWKADLDADPEWQGEKRAAKLAVIGSAIERFGSPKLKDALNITGAGNNPEVIRWAYNMAEKLSEGKPIPAGGTVPQKKTGANALYGKD